MLRRIWHHLLYMQYEHEGIEIAISIHEFQTLSIDSGIDQLKPHHRISCCLNMADDLIQAYQSKQTIGNSEKCCDNFGSIYFICNMSMNESRYPYQYTNSEHSQLIAESNSENRIIVHLVPWTRRSIEFDSIKSC